MKLVKNKHGYAALVPMILAIIITFAILYIGAYVNGTVNDELGESFGSVHKRESAKGIAYARMNNTSWNFDSALDIVQVTIIITVLASAIGAIFLFTRFRM